MSLVKSGLWTPPQQCWGGVRNPEKEGLWTKPPAMKPVDLDTRTNNLHLHYITCTHAYSQSTEWGIHEVDLHMEMNSTDKTNAAAKFWFAYVWLIIHSARPLLQTPSHPKLDYVFVPETFETDGQTFSFKHAEDTGVPPRTDFK